MGNREVKFVAELPLDLVKVEEKPLRTLFTGKGMEELRASIREHGVLVPISVVPDGEAFRLVAGLRRVEACRNLGFASIPALVGEMATSEELWAKFAENRVREPVSPLDEGLYIVERMNELGLSQAEVAAALDVSEGWVSQRVGILRWPEDVQASLGGRLISFGVGRELAAIVDTAKRRHFLRYAEFGGCSVRQAAEWRRQVARAEMIDGGVGGAEAQPERAGGESELADCCFLCERDVGLEGSRFLRICEDCLSKLEQGLERKG